MRQANEHIGVEQRSLPNSNSNYGKAMTHHNQTNVLTTWLLNLPLNEYIGNKKHKVWISNPRPHEAQLEDQKPKKSSKKSFRRRKERKANKRPEKRQTKEAANQRKAKKSSKSKLPLK
jgi:hypothetical protein